MLVEWLMAVIIAFNPMWSQVECNDGDERCVEENKKREEDLRELASSILLESDRQGLDPLMVAAIIARESSFIPEPCTKRVPMGRVIRLEPGERPNTSTLEWECPMSSIGPICKKEVWNAEERDGYLYYSTCSANEIGYMQIVPWTEWAQAGSIIPGTEISMANSSLYAERNSRRIHIVGDDEFPNINGTIAIQLALPDSTDRDNYPDLWGSIVTDVTIDEYGVHLTTLESVPERLDGFRDFIIAQALPRSGRERRELLLNTRVNIAIGCMEIADHRRYHERPGEEWWDWIGTYNTGSRGPGARAYSRRILSQYISMCETVIPSEDGLRLKDVWPQCAYVIERSR